MSRVNDLSQPIPRIGLWRVFEASEPNHERQFLVANPQLFDPDLVTAMETFLAEAMPEPDRYSIKRGKVFQTCFIGVSVSFQYEEDRMLFLLKWGHL